MCVYTYILLHGGHVCIYIHIATWRPCVYNYTYTMLLGDHVCIYIHIATWRPCVYICIYVATWSHVLCLLYCLFMDCCLPHIPICILWLREEYSCISFTISSPDCTMHTAIYHMVAALEGRFPRAICPKKARETLHSWRHVVCCSVQCAMGLEIVNYCTVVVWSMALCVWAIMEYYLFNLQ